MKTIAVILLIAMLTTITVASALQSKNDTIQKFSSEETRIQENTETAIQYENKNNSLYNNTKNSQYNVVQPFVGYSRIKKN